MEGFTGSVRLVNPLLEIWIIVLRELRKNFRSVKGIALLALSLLGGGVLALAYAFLEQKKKEFGVGGKDMDLQAMRQQGLETFFGDKDIASYLAPSPEGITIATFCSYWLLPLLIAIVGFDGISGEVQHRSVRFWTARSRKTSYYIGKFVGLWLTVSAMLLVTHAIVWGVLIVFGASNATAVLGWGLRYYITLIPVAGAWTGVAVLLASQFRAPLVSLLSVCTLFFVMFTADKVGMVVANFRKAGGQTDAKNWINYIYPSAYDDFLLHPSPKMWGLGLALCAAFIVVTTGAGMTIFQKRDV